MRGVNRRANRTLVRSARLRSNKGIRPGDQPRLPLQVRTRNRIGQQQPVAGGQVHRLTALHRVPSSMAPLGRQPGGRARPGHGGRLPRAEAKCPICKHQDPRALVITPSLGFSTASSIRRGATCSLSYLKQKASLSRQQPSNLRKRAGLRRNQPRQKRSTLKSILRPSTPRMNSRCDYVSPETFKASEGLRPEALHLWGLSPHGRGCLSHARPYRCATGDGTRHTELHIVPYREDINLSTAIPLSIYGRPEAGKHSARVSTRPHNGAAFYGDSNVKTSETQVPVQ